MRTPEIRIKLTDEEINSCEQFAAKLAFKYTQEQSGEKYDKYFKNFIVGNVGEYAYSKHVNLPVNFKITPKGKGDDGADLPGVQIKTVAYSGPYDLELKVNSEDKCFTNPTVKKIVLMYAPLNKNFREVCIVGEISVENFKDRCRLGRYGKSTYVVDENQLDVINECAR